MPLRLYLIYLILPISLTSGAQNISIRASLDTNQLMLGEQTTLTLEVVAPKYLTMVLPALTDTLCAKVELVGMPVTDSVWAGELLTLTHRAVLTSFDSGFYSLPPLEVIVRGQGYEDTLYSNPLTLAVFTMPVDTTKEIYDIKPQMEIPITAREIALLIGGVLLLSVIIFGIVYYLRRRRNQLPLFGAAKPVIPPYDQAITRLEAIRSEKLWQQGRVKEFYTRVTDVVRLYIEDELRIPAMEQITWEIIRTLQQQQWPQDTIDDTSKLLQEADMVKFAKEEPLPDQNDANLTLARAIVDSFHRAVLAKLAVESNVNKPENHA